MTELQLPIRIIQAISEYVRLRPAERPVSIARLTRAARFADPELDMSDRELANRLAAELMHAGVLIEFDGRGAGAPDHGVHG